LSKFLWFLILLFKSSLCFFFISIMIILNSNLE
jgi:hypothetical protein